MTTEITRNETAWFYRTCAVVPRTQMQSVRGRWARFYPLGPVRCPRAAALSILASNE